MSDEWTGNCTRCHRPITETERCATTERPFCPMCWMIDFYGFPEDRLKRVEAELARYRTWGVDEETLKKLLWSALRAHADKRIRQKMEGMTPMLDRILAIRRDSAGLARDEWEE